MLFSEILPKIQELSGVYESDPKVYLEAYNTVVRYYLPTELQLRELKRTILYGGKKILGKDLLLPHLDEYEIPYNKSKIKTNELLLVPNVDKEVQLLVFYSDIESLRDYSNVTFYRDEYEQSKRFISSEKLDFNSSTPLKYVDSDYLYISAFKTILQIYDSSDNLIGEKTISALAGSSNIVKSKIVNSNFEYTLDFTNSILDIITTEVGDFYCKIISLDNSGSGINSSYNSNYNNILVDNGNLFINNARDFLRERFNESLLSITGFVKLPSIIAIDNPISPLLFSIIHNYLVYKVAAEVQLQRSQIDNSLNEIVNVKEQQLLDRELLKTAKDRSSDKLYLQDNNYYSGVLW